jgi:hypothetical protein
VSSNTLTFVVTFPATAAAAPTALAAAGVTGVVAPATGAAPIAVGALTAGAATYTTTSITWQNADGSAATLTGGNFNASSTYKASIVLTSAAGYKFPAGGLTPTVNTGTPAAGTVSGGDVSGNTLTFVVTFPATAAASSGGGGGGGAVVNTPAVQTEAASTITSNAAVLNGNISSNNGYNITDYGFLWGTSANSLTNKLDVGTDNHSGAITATLSSLTAGTTYYVQAYATNSYGTVDGAILSFVTTSLQTTTPPQPIAPLFSDVSASYWGYNAISSLSSKGIVSGYPDGTFKPEASITRAEFATMLVKALGLNTSGTTGTFTDVTADAWYYGTVNAAASASLVSGMGDNLFAPNTLITREQMAVMVTKALGNKAPTTDGTELNAFSDKSAVSSWAVSGMEEAVKSGIVSGMTASTIAPLDNATRAQAAEMIYNLLPVLGK